MVIIWGIPVLIKECIIMGADNPKDLIGKFAVICHKVDRKKFNTQTHVWTCQIKQNIKSHKRTQEIPNIFWQVDRCTMLLRIWTQITKEE